MSPKVVNCNERQAFLYRWRAHMRNVLPTYSLYSVPRNNCHLNDDLETIFFEKPKTKIENDNFVNIKKISKRHHFEAYSLYSDA